MIRTRVQIPNAVTRISSNTMTRMWNNPMMGAAPKSVVEQERRVANGQSEDCLSYCSSIYTLYKYVLVWHNQRINEVDQPMRIKNRMAPFPDGAILAE